MTQYTSDGTNDAERRQEFNQDLFSYVLGYGLALILTLIPFWLVYRDVLPTDQVLIVTGVLAFIQMIVHFRLFLHIGLKRQREDLHLILFSSLLLAMMVAGTIWVMTDLANRMMPAALQLMDFF